MSGVRCSTFFLLVVAVSAPLRLGALDPATPLEAYERQSWQTEGGLPQNTVHAVLQTRDAYLWIATDSGLARFDGFQFATFTAENTPALPSNQIRALGEDTGGNLRVETAAGTVVRTSAGWAPASKIETLAGPPVLHDAAGHVWVASNHGLTETYSVARRTYTTADGL